MPNPASTAPRFLSWAFFLLGLGGACLFGYFVIWPPIRANLFFVETTCVVLDKRLGERTGGGHTSYRPEIHIEYNVNGVPQRAWTYDAAGVFSLERAAQQRTLDEFRIGGQYPCWFDPQEPGRAVLTRRFTWWCLMVSIPLLFMTSGAIGLMSKRPPASRPISTMPLPAETWRLLGTTIALFFGGLLVATGVALALMPVVGGFGPPPWLTKVLFFAPFAAYLVLFILFLRRQAARFRLALPSPERAATSATPVEDAAEPWPTVPALPVDPTAGSTLRYRLTSSTGPWRSLAAISAIALFWNAVVSIFLVRMIEGHRAGKPEWFLTVFLIPFVLIGLVLFAAVLWAALQAGTSILSGRVSVEVSDCRMRPGGSYEFLVEQPGPSRLGRVRLVLACTESATYTQGTNTRTESKEVANEGVGRAESLPPDGLRGTLTIPADAMHSFESAHNKITWTLRVEGRIGVLPYQCEYPVIVLPAPEGVSA